VKIRQEVHRNRGRGASKKLFAALITAVVAALALAIPALAANPPAFPNNIVIFPERDFVVLEGYERKAGQKVTVTVSRKGVQTSSARGVVGRGDPSLEINHPGGVCWRGVTPDIKPGDVVTAAFQDGRRDSARTLDAAVTGFQQVGAQLVVNGTVGPGVNTAFMEQRVIAPAFRDTPGSRITRRDIRADAAGGRVEGVPGGTGDLTFANPTSPTNWTATYTGLNATEIEIALEAGEVEHGMRINGVAGGDAGGDRQGLTIYERGEAGGPGFGGCPQGPEATVPNAPRNVAAAAGNRSVTATWARATTIPDSPAVTGYRVTAINIASGLQTSVNVAADARTATVPNLTNGRDYRVQVRALSDAGSGRPGTAGPVTPRATAP